MLITFYLTKKKIVASGKNSIESKPLSLELQSKYSENIRYSVILLPLIDVEYEGVQSMNNFISPPQT